MAFLRIAVISWVPAEENVPCHRVLLLKVGGMALFFLRM